jgi:hypothetical protein
VKDDPTSDDASTDEIVPDHIRAVGAIYAAWQLEELRLFEVVDRLVERFMHGQLPVGTEAGGEALERYYRDRDERLTRRERFALYSRTLEATQGDSAAVTPTLEFEDLLRRFAAAVADCGRQQRAAEVVAERSEESLSLTSERVRLAGRQLALHARARVSSATQAARQRLIDETGQALEILKTPEILSAYRVQSPFQVIERVAASDLGATVPNIVRHKTMAEAGKAILDIVAANAWLWSAEAGQRIHSSRISGDLARHAERWLKAAGISQARA